MSRLSSSTSKPRRWGPLAVVILLLTGNLLTACSSSPNPNSNGETTSQANPSPGIYTVAKVTRVVDGDTIDVEHVSGPDLPATRIRLIGVDAPEIHSRTESYGAEASAFAEERLGGRTAWLEKDVSETDRYGRALRYVWLSEPSAEPTAAQVREHLFNAILLVHGYANIATFPPDVKYVDWLVELHREARTGNHGLWSLQPAPTGRDAARSVSVLQVVAVNSPVPAGHSASLTVETDPGAVCSIKVRYKAGPSKANGLEPKTADHVGRITWTWTVGSATNAGRWPIEISCGDRNLLTEFEVIR